MDTNPIRFREEVLQQFFDYVKTGDSFYVIGAPSVGKTRLMDFLLGDDPDNTSSASGPVDREQIKRHYLPEEDPAKIWLTRVDMNRMRYDYDWSFIFYQLMLHTLLLACNRLDSTEENESIKNSLADLDSRVIDSKDALMAHRLFEMAVNMLCQFYRMKICFLFDEFDETYKTMPRDVFAQLRAVRDANKYRVSYALFLRNLPDKLRMPTENEEFYELISRNMLGIGPYSPDDSFHIMGQLENRRKISLTQEQRDWIYTLSGGHPGFIQALLKSIRDQPPQSFTEMPDADWYPRQEFAQEESRKIWIGLLEDEKTGLLQFVQQKFDSVPAPTKKLLEAKGLLIKSDTNGHLKVFSPLFAYWLSKQP